MSRVKGEVRTCDRCGYSQLFKFIGTTELDGGFSKSDKFEEAKGWSYLNNMDLCPECSEQWEETKRRFMEAFVVREEKRETEKIY